MSTLEKAVALAARAHAGTVDKQGAPYLLHPLRVMLSVQDATAQIVGVLHDVVEDTPYSLQDLVDEGFSNEVIEALERVTHRPEQPYHEYVIGCRRNPHARQVKLADLRDNASLERVLMRPERLSADAARVQRYVLAYRFLTDQISEDQYRAASAATEPNHP
jgi:(p)ppGpp synthase/HD superfamily hydrolase